MKTPHIKFIIYFKGGGLGTAKLFIGGLEMMSQSMLRVDLHVKDHFNLLRCHKFDLNVAIIEAQNPSMDQSMPLSAGTICTTAGSP